MSIDVLSSSYGSYDIPPNHVLQSEPCTIKLIKDHSGFAQVGAVHINEDRPHLHPRMAAKVAKCMPWLYSDADIIIWIDNSIEMTSPDFVGWMYHHREKGCCISEFIHPHRDDLQDEWDASRPMAKYQGQNIGQQCLRYEKEGFPRHWGMWATGWAVWDLSTPKLRAEAEVLGEAWLLEQVRWSYQDQISQPYVSWKHGIPIGTLPGSIFDPPHCTLRPHTRND